MPLPFDLDTYSAEAESFVNAMEREYYLHFAGHRRSYGIEAIYERHASLFAREAVQALQELLGAASAGDSERRRRYLLRLAVEGFFGRASRAEAAELAEREASLEVEAGGERLPYRGAALVQSTESDPSRRAEIERARLAALEAELSPLYAAIAERTHALVSELGWPSYRALYERLKDVDLVSLGRRTAAFTAQTDRFYREALESQLVEQLGFGFEALGRSDLPYFLRARSFDRMFPEDRLVGSLLRTLAGLGIDLDAQAQVRLDLEQRPSKSPRAFCAPVQVPDEVYLVMPVCGGREDFATLMHEAGHAEHYANVDPGLRFEFRHLGDNSVTEGFAFLFEHLTESPAWLETMLGLRDLGTYLNYVRANKLIYLRRYAAKLAYELELHGGARPPGEMPALYARLLGEAVGVEWPATTYLSDVDEGFYAANYLRAWALETFLRGLLVDRYGEKWFAHAEAGDFLRSLWHEGQRLGAEELLAEMGCGELDFGVMISEVSV